LGGIQDLVGGSWGEEFGQEVGGVAIGTAHGVGVDVDGGGGTGVTEALGDTGTGTPATSRR
jgi:hypothetical protein